MLRQSSKYKVSIYFGNPALDNLVVAEILTAINVKDSTTLATEQTFQFASL